MLAARVEIPAYVKTALFIELRMWVVIIKLMQ
jgi:hypothetical protein